jgi:hypothetical protein
MPAQNFGNDVVAAFMAGQQQKRQRELDERSRRIEDLQMKDMQDQIAARKRQRELEELGAQQGESQTLLQLLSGQPSPRAPVQEPTGIAAVLGAPFSQGAELTGRTQLPFPTMSGETHQLQVPTQEDLQRQEQSGIEAELQAQLSAPFTLSPGQGRFSGNDQIASIPAEAPQAPTTIRELEAIFPGFGQMTDEQKLDALTRYSEATRQPGVTVNVGDQTEGPSPYSVERNIRTRNSVATLEQEVGALTVGPLARLTVSMPGSPARNFAAELNTLKASIAFGELTAMREASKTGGALGQVSERELALLESSLGALDQFQSPENFRDELRKIRESIDRFERASAAAGGGGAASGSSELTPDMLDQFRSGTLDLSTLTDAQLDALAVEIGR